MTGEPKVLIPYDRAEAVTVRVAARLAGVSEQTLRNWCDQHQIGRRVAGGPWQVSRPALGMLLDGDNDALRQYLAGDRAGRVAEYFRRAGLHSPQVPQIPKELQPSHGGRDVNPAILRRTSED